MIEVIGLGPGSEDYILPAAIKAIKRSDMIIGAKRNLASIEEYCDATMDLSVGFEAIGKYLIENSDLQIGVVVSGDSGFYSMLDFVRRHVDKEKIRTIPGISSLQYMYSRLGIGYELAKWISFHGRECDLSHCLRKRKPMGILTDKDKNNRYIAGLLKAKGVTDAVMFVGERLSYEDEKITKLTVEEALTYEADPLSVVVIEYED